MGRTIGWSAVLSSITATAEYGFNYPTPIRGSAYSPSSRKMFVVAHVYYVLLASVFYWLSKWTGRTYNQHLAKVFFCTNIIGFDLTLFPRHFPGLAGILRRIADDNAIHTECDRVSSIGAFVFGLSFALFAYIVAQTVHAGNRVQNPVRDEADGLEWELPCQPPFHGWTKAPVVT